MSNAETLELVEAILRWAGGVLTFGTLGAIFYGIWKGTRHQGGRQVGSSPGWLRSPLFYIVTSAIFFWVCIALWMPLPLTLSPLARALALAAGSLVFFPGMGLILWGRLTLGKMYFVSTGMGAELFADHRLVTHGPFGLVRHPMYTGIALAAIGGVLLYQTWTLVAMLLLPLGLARRAWREEQALAAEFGEEWQEYCQQTPAFLPRMRR